jgi:hypothetical protein
MDIHEDGAFGRLDIVETGRRRRWSAAAKEASYPCAVPELRLISRDMVGPERPRRPAIQRQLRLSFRYRCMKLSSSPLR